jgi:hypothetical protein
MTLATRNQDPIKAPAIRSIGIQAQPPSLTPRRVSWLCVHNFVAIEELCVTCSLKKVVLRWSVLTVWA